MVTQKTIILRNFGESIGTRVLGEKIRQGVISDLSSGIKVTFDLSGVEVLSNSFADECFGKLLAFFPLSFIKEHTHFANTNDFVRMVILKAIQQRSTSSALV